MRTLLKSLIRNMSYPLIAGGAALLLLYLATVGAAYWPLFPLVVAVGITLVALLERVAPYEAEWNRDHDGDTVADALHLFVSYLLIQGSVAFAFGLRTWLPENWVIWPQSAPTWAQVLLAGLILGMIQAATSINEQTLSFVPKLIVVAVSLMIFGGLIIGLLSDFMISQFDRIPDLVK